VPVGLSCSVAGRDARATVLRADACTAAAKPEQPVVRMRSPPGRTPKGKSKKVKGKRNGPHRRERGERGEEDRAAKKMIEAERRRAGAENGVGCRRWIIRRRWRGLLEVALSVDSG